MRKTIYTCDRCNKEISLENVRFFKTTFLSGAIEQSDTEGHLCRKCYKDFQKFKKNL